MNATEFSLNAKLGLLNARSSRPISNKGTISAIRKRTEAGLRPPGFPSYANLGSQNAITTGGGGNEARLVIDIETPKSTEATFVKPTEVSLDKKKVQEIKDDARDKKADAIKPPLSQPPFYVDSPQGRKDFNEWANYLAIKFWRLVDTDLDPFNALNTDSLGYTKFMNDRLKVANRIEMYYKKHPFSRFVDAVMPFLVELGQFGVDILSDEAKRRAQGGASLPPVIPGTEETMQMKAMREAKKFIESTYPPDVVINKVRDFVKNILPKKYTSYEEGMKGLLKEILDAHPTWRARMKKDFDEKYNKEIRELTKEIEKMSGLD
jgi:hypothetical protein